GGVPEELPEDAPWFFKDYQKYYKTDRGYHARSANSNEGRVDTAKLQFINMPTATNSSEIRNAVLMIHGEKAHSCYFSQDEFKKLKGDNKELMIIPGATHVDLYDNLEVIPFDKMVEFFHKYMNV
ncbi:MAG: alpha/beta hydrolase, partial [Eubacteriales bacterium]|nr:alpha/beta hydrolase [Eubacteriales bacterium]